MSCGSGHAHRGICLLWSIGSDMMQSWRSWMAESEDAMNMAEKILDSWRKKLDVPGVANYICKPRRHIEPGFISVMHLEALEHVVSLRARSDTMDFAWCRHTWDGRKRSRKS